MIRTNWNMAATSWTTIPVKKRPESIQDGGVVDLQQRNTRSQGGEQVEAEPGVARARFNC